MRLEDVEVEFLRIVSTRGAEVLVPFESERFFTRLVEAFRGTREELLEHVRAHAPRWFCWIDQPPEWIHGAEWQFGEDGQPMAFAGQLTIPFGVGIFHDEAQVFVFVDLRSGAVKTVTQVA